MEAVIERAVADAGALAGGGMDALLVENYGDVPFRRGRVGPWTVAALTLAVSAVREAAARLPVGVNVLRNDARAALGVAAATGASFVRVNVHTGTMLTDQGVLQGRADRTLRARRALGASVAIVADVHVKHAVPPAGATLEGSAADARLRGLADVLVVTGARTGGGADPAEIRRVADAVPGTPVWVGSGVTPDNVASMLEVADGVIVGSALHRDGVAGRGVERRRVERLVRALRG
jgi:membrane complex biogenesis BtpA family protein